MHDLVQFIRERWLVLKPVRGELVAMAFLCGTLGIVIGQFFAQRELGIRQATIDDLTQKLTALQNAPVSDGNMAIFLKSLTLFHADGDGDAELHFRIINDGDRIARRVSWKFRLGSVPAAIPLKSCSQIPDTIKKGGPVDIPQRGYFPDYVERKWKTNTEAAQVFKADRFLYFCGEIKIGEMSVKEPFCYRYGNDNTQFILGIESYPLPSTCPDFEGTE